MLPFSFKYKSSTACPTLNHPTSSACFDIISLLLLFLFSLIIIYFCKIYSFISQITMHVLLLPHSILFWSTIHKFCSINGWHNKKNPPKPPYSQLQVLFLPYFLFIWLPKTVSVTFCTKKVSHPAIKSCLWCHCYFWKAAGNNSRK